MCSQLQSIALQYSGSLLESASGVHMAMERTGECTVPVWVIRQEKKKRKRERERDRVTASLFPWDYIRLCLGWTRCFFKEPINFPSF